MKTLSGFIKASSPQFNLTAVEGLVYHRVKKAVEYIDAFIKYNVQSKTHTHLRYLGFKELHPKEVMKFLFQKSSKVVYDIAENDIYLVKFFFQYGNNPEIKEYCFYVPYMNKGNEIHLSGNKFLVMPILADKVISVGERIIFINILTAKYSFSRSYFSVRVDGRYNRVSLINTELYKNQAKKLEDTTRANTTVMHYLLANYGYSKVMEMLLGFVPIPTYDDIVGDKTMISSTGNKPQGYIKNRNLYAGTNIKFAVDKAKYNEHVLYVIGNIFYILDNFPETITIDEMDNTVMWKRLLAEIIHSGNHGIAYLSEKINAHFNDLNSSFDAITIQKLSDVGQNARSLIELLGVIFENFNNWILNSESRSLYHNKTYEVESFVLSHLTSRITRIVLDINKEELRINGGVLENHSVDKIFQKYFIARGIFFMKKDKQYVTSVENSGDHLYPKNTAMVVQQESDFVNINSPETTNANKKKIVASMATIGSIVGLSKNNPTPVIRLNPYVNIDPVNGTVLPHPTLDGLVRETDKLLSNLVQADSLDLPTTETLEDDFESEMSELYDDDGSDTSDQIDLDS